MIFPAQQVRWFTGVWLGLAIILSGGADEGRAHGAYHQVRRDLEARLATDPDNPDLHFRLAVAHQSHEEWKLTLAELAKVDKLAPGRFPTGWVRGQALATAGRWQESSEVLDQFLKTQPGHAGALLQRGLTRYALGRTGEAEADLVAATAAAGADTPVEFYQQAAQALLQHGAAGAAVKVMAHGAERVGADNLDILNLGVEAGLQAKDLALALRCAERLEKLWPVPEEWIVRRAEILSGAGRNREALAVWEELTRRLEAMPALQRQRPQIQVLEAKANQALGRKTIAPVVAPPAAGEPRR